METTAHATAEPEVVVVPVVVVEERPQTVIGTVLGTVGALLLTTVVLSGVRAATALYTGVAAENRRSRRRAAAR